MPPTLIAAKRGQGDFAIGHAFGAVIGSLLLLGGGLALWMTTPAPRSLQHIEIPWLIVLARRDLPDDEAATASCRAAKARSFSLAYALFLVGEAWMAHGT